MIRIQEFYQGSKSGQGLYGKDLASAIRQELKDNGITGCTVRAGKATYTTTITVTVKGTPNDKLSFEEFKNSKYYNGLYNYVWLGDREMDKFDFLTAVQHERDFEDSDDLLRQYYDCNIANKKNFDFVLNVPERFNSMFTKSFVNKLTKIQDVIKDYWYEDNDVMSDYFDTNFYYTVEIVFQ